MITKTGDFLKKVILIASLLKSVPLCIVPVILLTNYMYAEPVNNGACLMNNQEYLCLVLTRVEYQKPEWVLIVWVNF